MNTLTKIKKPRPKGYWILWGGTVCTVCGDEDRYQLERVFDRPKPKDPRDRDKITIGYCGCMNYELYGH